MTILRRTCFAVLLLTCLSQAVAFAQTGSSGGVPEGAGPVALRDGWSLQSNCKVEKSGEVISTARFQPTGWYTVTVPTTVVAALVKHKVYPDPGFGMNLRSYPGMSYPIGTNFSNIAMHSPLRKFKVPSVKLP